MPKGPRAELLKIQKKLWRWNKEIIECSVLVKEPGFDRYERNYRNAVKEYQRVADLDEMMEAILLSDIVYVGDYHTCNQSQRSFLRMLKAVVKKDPNFVLALELIHKKYQSVLDEYLAGEIEEKDFLRRIKLREHWVFDLWESFKPLFDFCRYHKIPIVAIDSAPMGSDVSKRDVASAKLIARVMKKYRDRRLFVFIGDLHIAPQHLPKDVTRELKTVGLKKRPLILFQNSEPIYWKLAEEGADDFVQVVKLKSGHYCRMHTPPVILQRSYLNWLEHEEGEIDYADAKSSFLELVDSLCTFLKLKLGGARDEVEIFTCGDLSFLERLEERGGFTKKEITTIKQQILASESYYIAKSKMVYLANLSINHAAEEASHFIKNVCSGNEEPREVVDAFYANILHEALGFFGSKIINQKRKCFHSKDFKNLLAYFQTVHVPQERKLEYETAHLITEYKKLEKKGAPLEQTEIFNSRMDLFLSVTHALGYMLGDKLYYGMMKGNVKKPQIKKLFMDPWLGDGVPVAVYMKLLKKLKGVRIPKRL
jgi:heme-binding uptake protein ChaN (Tiki superfamily)